MIRSVAKHKYISGKNGKARGRAHINYIAHRGGPDREQGGRKFFDKEREDIDAREVKQLMYERADDRGVTIHKLMLSPGLDTDAKEYTRELMDKLSQEKALALEWRAVVHDNTDHQHVHVVVMGKDRNGHQVRFDRSDHSKLRQFGDEYLEREHKLERYLDREMHDLLKSREYDRSDTDLRKLVFGERDERDKKRDKERDLTDFDELDRALRKAFEDKRSVDLYPVRGEQRILEQAGRLAEHHGDYTRSMASERLERIAEDNPELAQSIKGELDYMHEIATENRIHLGRDFELEKGTRI